MSRKLTLILILVILSPLLVTGFFGYRQLVDQEAMLITQRRLLLSSQGEDLNELLDNVMRQAGDEVLQVLDSVNPAQLSNVRHPLVIQWFLLDSAGQLLYPDTTSSLNRTEAAFVQRTRMLWEGTMQADWDRRKAPDEYSIRKLLPETQDFASDTRREASSPATENHQWLPWYWEEGLHLLLRKKINGGALRNGALQDGALQKSVPVAIVGAELETMALLSRIIQRLPSSTKEPGVWTLRNSRNEVLYLWGGGEARTEELDESVLYSSRLQPPLQSWTISFSDPDGEWLDAGVVGQRYYLLILLLVLILVVVAGGTYMYRETSREYREARQRVNFVNQVSHELKTPLTNICLYAELLERYVNEEDLKARSHLNVIQEESQRLSRMIHNILNFSRQDQGRLRLQLQNVVPDECVQRVVDSFRPALAARKMAVDFSPGAPNPISLDSDACNQIVGNLLSNAEKYASQGAKVEVSCHQDQNQTTICVRDFGQGIAPADREKIFIPFERLQHSLEEGVSGTGIGLAISRDLARLHGGDLVLKECSEGACFCWVIPHEK